MVGYLAIGFFFFHFWRRTRDSLFGAFAASFWVLAIERVLLLITANPVETEAGIQEFRPYVYWVRFFAFMLIIGAFYLKNRRAN